MTYEYKQIGTTNECYVAGLVGSANMSTVPVNGVIDGVSYKVIDFDDDCLQGNTFTMPILEIYKTVHYRKYMII